MFRKFIEKLKICKKIAWRIYKDLRHEIRAQ